MIQPKGIVELSLKNNKESDIAFTAVPLLFAIIYVFFLIFRMRRKPVDSVPPLIVTVITAPSDDNSSVSSENSRSSTFSYTKKDLIFVETQDSGHSSITSVMSTSSSESADQENELEIVLVRRPPRTMVLVDEQREDEVKENAFILEQKGALKRSSSLDTIETNVGVDMNASSCWKLVPTFSKQVVTKQSSQMLQRLTMDTGVTPINSAKNCKGMRNVGFLLDQLIQDGLDDDKDHFFEDDRRQAVKTVEDNSRRSFLRLEDSCNSFDTVDTIETNVDNEGSILKLVSTPSRQVKTKRRSDATRASIRSSMSNVSVLLQQLMEEGDSDDNEDEMEQSLRDKRLLIEVTAGTERRSTRGLDDLKSNQVLIERENDEIALETLIQSNWSSSSNAAFLLDHLMENESNREDNQSIGYFEQLELATPRREATSFLSDDTVFRDSLVASNIPFSSLSVEASSNFSLTERARSDLLLKSENDKMAEMTLGEFNSSSSSLVVIEESGRKVASFSGSLALIALKVKLNGKNQRFALEQKQDSSAKVVVVRKHLSLSGVPPERQLDKQQHGTTMRPNSVHNSAISSKEVTEKALKSLERYLECCVARRVSMEQALDESITGLDGLLGEIFYSPAHELMTLQQDLARRPEIFSYKGISSSARLSLAGVVEEQQRLTVGESCFLVTPQEDLTRNEVPYESFLGEDFLCTRALQVFDFSQPGDGDDIERQIEKQATNLRLSLADFHAFAASLNEEYTCNASRSSSLSLATTTDTKRLSYCFLGQKDAEALARREGNELSYAQNIDGNAKKVGKKCVSTSHKKRLKNARLVIRAVLGPHRKDYKTSTACFEAIDSILVFFKDIQLAVQEISKGEVIWRDLQAAWSMIWQNKEEEVFMAFPSMPEDKSVDAYEYSVLIVRQIYKFLFSSSPCQIEPNIYPVLGILPSEEDIDDECLLHLGTVGGGMASVSVPLKCPDSKRKKRTRVTPYDNDQHYPLSLQDALRVVRSILGPSQKRVSCNDCLRCLQIYALLKIKYRELTQQLHGQRALLKILNHRLRKLHRSLKKISKELNGAATIENIHSVVGENKLSENSNVDSVALQVYGISGIFRSRK